MLGAHALHGLKPAATIAAMALPWIELRRSAAFDGRLEAVPGEFMTDRARRFTLSLLTHTQRELSETT